MPSNPGRVAPLPPDELSAEQQRALGAWKDLTFAQVLLRTSRSSCSKAIRRSPKVKASLSP